MEEYVCADAWYMFYKEYYAPHNYLTKSHSSLFERLVDCSRIC